MKSILSIEVRGFQDKNSDGNQAKKKAIISSPTKEANGLIMPATTREKGKTEYLIQGFL